MVNVHIYPYVLTLTPVRGLKWLFTITRPTGFGPCCLIWWQEVKNWIVRYLPRQQMSLLRPGAFKQHSSHFNSYLTEPELVTYPDSESAVHAVWDHITDHASTRKAVQVSICAYYIKLESDFPHFIFMQCHKGKGEIKVSYAVKLNVLNFW